MDLSGYLLALRRSAALVVLCVIVGTAIGVGYVARTQKVYTTSVKLFVSVPAQSTSDIADAATGSEYTLLRVKSYADLVTTPAVTNAVSAAPGIDTSPGVIAGELTAVAPANESLLIVSVTDGSPVRAQTIANAAGAQLAQVVSQLEAPTGGGPSPVKVSIVQPAGLPGVPTKPNKRVDVALGVLVGLLIGAGAAVVRQTLDTKVRTKEDIQRVSGLATLGIIAFDSDAGKKPLVVQVSPHSQRAEAFRQLRTNLAFIDVDNPPKSLVITSALPREGKSTTTTNLAITFAQAGRRVLLVEGDLRRPRVTRYAGLPDALKGLTDVLVGRAVLSDVIRPFDGVPTLSILPAGSNPPNPSELLASKQMQSVLAELETSYDMVLIDAPPLLPVTDGAILGSIADGTIMVVRAAKTTEDQVARSTEALASVDVRIVGAVLNMVPQRGAGGGAYAYGARYGSDRGYGGYGDGPAAAGAREDLPESLSHPAEPVGPVVVNEVPGTPLARGNATTDQNSGRSAPSGLRALRRSLLK